MGWEKRGNYKYYYEKEWVDGKCVSTYRGSGEIASLMGQLEKGQRLEKLRDRAAESRTREIEQSIDDAIDTFSELNRNLVDALFLINGYHQHKRQWRKKR